MHKESRKQTDVMFTGGDGHPAFKFSGKVTAVENLFFQKYEKGSKSNVWVSRDSNHHQGLATRRGNSLVVPGVL
jgi:hypothetical protein